MKKWYIVGLLLALSGFTLKGQNQSITIHQDSCNFAQFVEDVENQTSLFFFYPEQWVKELKITVHEDNQPIQSILSKVCIPNDLSFAFINNNQVVITKNYKLKTNFDKEYQSFLTTRKKFDFDASQYFAPKHIEEEKKEIDKEYQLFTIGSPSVNSEQTHAILSGRIKDIETGEPLIAAVVYIEALKIGTATDIYGYYNISIPKGQHKIEYRSIGMKTTYRNIVMHSDGALNVEMHNKPTSLKEVLVTQKSDDPVRNLRMGMEKLTMKSLKQLPMGFGEADIIKSSLLLPGVQSVGEAASGFNVRGGSIDQNLILLNDAPIMNTSHFFGFFSGFNSDVIKDITLYKSGIPAKYGGRVSSVMDITMKDGNRKKLKMVGGISPVSGRFTIEAPIVKDKCSFVIGARTTYSDWVLGLLDDYNLKNSKANFYDVQGNLSWDINKKNSIYLSGYKSHDYFDYYSQDAFSYNSLASTLKWKHIFNPKLFSTFSAGISNYDYKLISRDDTTSMNGIKYALNQKSFKADFSYHPGTKHNLDFGLNARLYELSPGVREPLGGRSLIKPKTIEQEQALETALYFGDEFDITPNISLSAGLRYSFYFFLGPKTQFSYYDNQSKSEQSISDTTLFSQNQLVQFYSAPEFRLSSNIKAGPNSSVKLSVNRIHQFIHMISNTTSMSPTDIWKLSDSYIKPQRGDQFSIGYYQTIRRNSIEASVEAYYKSLKNILDYKGGAQLIMNEHLETDVLNGRGKAYGIEFMLEKKKGKLTGWANYTYSRVLHKIDGNFVDEIVNNGEYFPANYDKPHEFKMTANYKVSRRLNLSSNFFYSTGRPFTAPVAYFNFNNGYRIYYSERNALRMDDYIRVDFAATINGNLKKKKLNHSSLTFAVYNALGRQNPYSVFFKSSGGKVNGYKMSIFGQPIFTITYNFKIFGNAADDF